MTHPTTDQRAIPTPGLDGDGAMSPVRTPGSGNLVARSSGGPLEDTDPTPLPCGHPLAARAIRYMNGRYVTVCWACAIEEGLTPLYPGAGRGTMTSATAGSVGTTRAAAGVLVPPRPAR
jgi:hypothetical protein